MNSTPSQMWLCLSYLCFILMILALVMTIKASHEETRQEIRDLKNEFKGRVIVLPSGKSFDTAAEAFEYLEQS